jgi:hypothetical protein
VVPDDGANRELIMRRILSVLIGIATLIAASTARTGRWW